MPRIPSGQPRSADVTPCWLAAFAKDSKSRSQGSVVVFSIWIARKGLGLHRSADRPHSSKQQLAASVGLLADNRISQNTDDFVIIARKRDVRAS